MDEKFAVTQEMIERMAQIIGGGDEVGKCTARLIAEQIAEYLISLAAKPPQ